MGTNGVKLSQPLRTVLALLVFAAGSIAGSKLAQTCYVAYASGRLTQAAEQGQAGEAAYWLDRGANINAQNRFGDTPLMIAARNARPEVVHELLLRGANARLQDNFGLSAAQWANFHLRESRTLCLPEGFEIRQLPRPDAVKTVALLQGSRE